MRAHVVIVGGGVMGTAIAMYLARRCDPIEQPVLLLQRRDLGSGSSGRSGAILPQFYADSELASMARDSLRVWAGFQASTGYSVGFRRSGVLTLAGPDDLENREKVSRVVAMLRSIGVEAELLDASEVKRIAPGLSVADGTLTAYEPGGGFVEPMQVLQSFAAVARYHGATTRLGTEVMGFVVRDGRVVAVETVEGTIETSSVVVAAGPWTRRLLEQVGIDLPLKVVRPLQHFLATPSIAGRRASAAPAPPDAASTVLDTALRPLSSPESQALVAHPVLLDLEHGYYARCQPEQARTRIGGIDYSHCQELADPDLMDEAVDPAFGRWARAAIERRVPAYREQPDAGGLAALYTLTPDSQAVIGPLPGIAGMWVVSGFSGHGFKLAPSIGEGVARMVLGGPPGTFDAEFFDPMRFARGRQEASATRGAFGL